MEQADGGTLFLDEIAEMPAGAAIQAALVPGEPQFPAARGGWEREVKVRLIAASNQDLEELVAQGSSASDLFFRINVVAARCRPCAAGPGCAIIAEKFIDEFNRCSTSQVAGMDTPAASKLLAHQWPGNVRELRNVIERAMLFAPGSPTARLPETSRSAADGPRRAMSAGHGVPHPGPRPGLGTA